MVIKELKRPWQKGKRGYQKKTVDPWYQSQEWKRIRENHLMGYTNVNGYSLSNRFCLPCYKETGQHNATHTVDHITPIKEGGDKRGPLQSLCKHHNAIKTARDGNRQRKKMP